MKKKMDPFPKYCHLNLLLWIVALLLIAPLFQTNISGTLTNIFFTLILLSSAYTLSNQKSVRIVVGLSALLAITFNWLGYFYPAFLLNLLTLLFSLAFVGVTIFVLLKEVFNFEKIKVDQIFGALGIYCLIGLFWALLYALNELVVPHSFVSDFMSVIEESDDIMFHFNQFIYFSFITLTTTGFGDMIPLTVEARNLSVAEAIVGQFYIATLVASLVGAILQKKKNMTE